MAHAVVRRLLITAGLAGALCVLVGQAVGDSFVIPGSKAESETSCVEPTEFMRRNHMEVIKHQRDETVHGGIRSTKHSLAGCIDCHVSNGADGTLVPVNHEEQFCGACHAFTAVSLNCFDCHANIPSLAPGRLSDTSANEGLFGNPVVQTSEPQRQVPHSVVGGGSAQ